MARLWVRALAGLAAATLAAAVLAPAATARATVPPSFFGVVPQGSLTAPDLGRMEGTVGTLRVPVYWFEAEPLPGVYDFGALDAVVGAAAEHGIQVLPFVYGTPSWLAPDPARPPLASAAARQAWASFLRRLVRRYGPGGDFWRGRQRREPIRRWQIWNEPNFVLFWRPHPAPAAYARLLRIAAAAIRGVDPEARLVLAGVAPVSAGELPWVFLRRLYRVPGVKRDFDVAAVHPYAATLAKMRFQVVEARAVMAAAGDARTPLLVSELGVASQGDAPSAFVLGRAGQAAFLRDAFELLLRERRRWHIAGVDWFTWRDGTASDPHCAFCQGAGLLDAAGAPKPAWTAYRDVVAASQAGSGRPVH